MIKFGPSGAGELFVAEGHTKTVEMPSFLLEKGLDCFEYSFGRGVRMTAATGQGFAGEFSRCGIEISVHAPYFINMATDDEVKAKNNHEYIIGSIDALKLMGGRRCVFHPGSPLKKDRREAMDILLRRMDVLLAELYELGHSDILLAVETMGKQAQLGDENEIIDIVSRDSMLYPCIDFGHLNARTCGGMRSYDDFSRLLDKYIARLGYDKVNNMHVHFSKIEYTAKGEVRHLTFADNQYGPEFEPLAKALMQFDLSPYIICESAGTQTEDAMEMKRIYNNLQK